MSTLRLSPYQVLEIVEAGPERLVVVTTYGPGGTPPPAHYHPAQDEEFEVVAGAVRAQVDGAEHELAEGHSLTIRRGQVHKMWNPGDEPARVRWVTTPAMSTLQWFEGLDRLQARAEAQGRTTPDPLAFARHAAAHRDSYRLALGGPKFVGDAVVTTLAVVGGVFRR